MSTFSVLPHSLPLEDASNPSATSQQEVYDAYDQFMDRCVEYFLCKHEPPAGVSSVGEHIRLEVELYLAALPEREREVRRLLFEYLLKREAVISGSDRMEEVSVECRSWSFIHSTSNIITYIIDIMFILFVYITYNVTYIMYIRRIAPEQCTVRFRSVGFTSSCKTNCHLPTIFF